LGAHGLSRHRPPLGSQAARSPTCGRWGGRDRGVQAGNGITSPSVSVVRRRAKNRKKPSFSEEAGLLRQGFPITCPAVAGPPPAGVSLGAEGPPRWARARPRIPRATECATPRPNGLGADTSPHRETFGSL